MASCTVASSLAVGGWLWWRSRETAAPAAEVQRRVLTSYPGEETEPALSPDGKQVAFVWNGEQGNQYDLYVKLVDAGDPIRLTNTPPGPEGRERAPAWSPDGTFLAFCRDDGFYVIPALGGAVRKVAGNSRLPSHAPVLTVAWSPDGQALIIPDTSTEPPSLAAVSIRTGEKRKMTSPPAGSMGDFNPLVSPDGQWLAFSRSQNVVAGDWYVQPLVEPGTARQLTHAHGDLRGSGTWLPDGRELLLSLQVEGERRLWRVPVDGSAQARVPVLGDGDWLPSAARKGNRLVVASAWSDTNLWRLDLTRPEAPPVRVIASTREESQADYSPDGMRVAFRSSRSGRAELWIANADGTSPVQLTHGGAMPTAPRWSPDGKRIAFAKRPGGNADVYVVDAQGGEPRRLTTDPRNDASAYWSRDGQWIYYASNRSGQQQVWKTKADGSEGHTQVTRTSGWRSHEFAGGKMLAYQKWEQPGIWTMPLPEGLERKVSDSPPTATFFATGDTGFWYDAPRELHRVNLLTGEDRIIRRLPPSTGLGTLNFAVTPDLRWLLYVQVDQSIGDLTLLENFR